ncbi:thermonuclease family protein [Mesorhizobium sp. YM1C-6-2]|uniref:thermonuclease family protein n=1 Tax=Mesorhizobium sp. YM1C-6-2 TaxID=1827501 RepID=UPI000EF1ACE6|nr:thermonuclease family protein [Mesorhizobium sp. YM1C-6-2]RLP26036.1 thermonuclease family protein [Mesorhizobium sp. YM1C-6-2]
MDSRLTFVLLGAAALALAGKPASAAKLFHGPVEAAVLEVLDGDTFLAEALVWPGHAVRVNVRIRGIDAPEMKARCRAERAAAERARDALAVLFGDGPVAISNIAGAKYYGRVLADVTTADGQGVASVLLGEELVRPYGGGRRAGWCG